LKPFTAITILSALTWASPHADAQTAAGIVNTYYQVTSINTASNSLVVDDGSTLQPGELVLIIQSKGASIDASNTATFGNITVLGSAGNYEFNTICNVTGNEVWLKAPFSNTYDPGGQLQMVGVPSYQSVMVSGTVNSNPWDPSIGKGGIVAISAKDTIFLNADIDVSGQGFQGGYLVNYPTSAGYNCDAFTPVSNYFLNIPISGDFTAGRKGEGITAYILNEENGRGKLANGGGGGNNANTGGAGGGNYGVGGGGGKRAGESMFNCHGAFPGIGGLSLAPYGYSVAANRIFFGGGGGAGHENNAVGLPGGNGGGIIILSAPVIMAGGGRLLADGLAPLNPTNGDPTQAEGDGGGGGGAGGTVILDVPVINGSVIAEAKGAAGSNSSNGVNDCTGPGGGGGGGAIWTSGASFPAAISASVIGGINGVVSSGSGLAACRGSSDGATAGNAGSAQNGYILPLSAGSICVTLASPLLSYFKGDPLDQGSLLSWGLYAPPGVSGIVSFTLERSEDHIHFITLAILPSPADSESYRYTDPASLPGTVFYRLSWLNKQGLRMYSIIVTIYRTITPGAGAIRLYPDPVTDQLSVTMFSTVNEMASIRVFNAQGQQLAIYPLALHMGSNSLNIPVSGLASGAYFLVVESKSRRQLKSFIKRQ
jgi:hypothetical protein